MAHVNGGISIACAYFLEPVDNESDMELEFNSEAYCWQLTGCDMTIPCPSPPHVVGDVVWYPCEYIYFRNNRHKCLQLTATECADGSHFCRRHRPWTTHRLDPTAPRVRVVVTPLVTCSQPVHSLRETKF